MGLSGKTLSVVLVLVAAVGWIQAQAETKPTPKAEAKAAEAKPAEKPDAAKMAVDDVRTCMRANLVERGSLRDLSVTSTDIEGQPHSLKMKLFWKPVKGTGAARMNLRVLEPKDLKGSSYLLLEREKGEDVYFFLPANKTVLRVTGNEMTRPLWGTDFSYSEIRQVQGLLLDGATKRIADSTVGDRPVFVLETATKVESTGYRKVVAYVDQASCTLLKSEFFVRGEKPRKVLEADLSTLTYVEPYWLVLGYDMRNLVEGSHTKLTLSDLFLLERKSEQLFDPEQFFQAAE